MDERQRIIELLMMQPAPANIFGLSQSPLTMSDESPSPVMPGQQFAANTPSRSSIDMAAMRKLEEMRRAMGVQPTPTGNKATDDALKAIDDALRYAPK